MSTGETYIPIEPIVFEHNDRRFRYHFDDLTIHQSTMVEELVNFKAEQLQKGAKSFQSVVDSGGADWLWKAASWLLREVVDGELKPVNAIQVEEAEVFVRNLPAKHMPKLREMIDDFFTQTGRRGLLSTLSPRQLKTSNAQEELFKILMSQALKSESK